MNLSPLELPTVSDYARNKVKYGDGSVATMRKVKGDCTS